MGHIACLMPLICDGCNAADRPKTGAEKAERERERSKLGEPEE